MNTQSIDISLYQKGDIALEDIYKKFKNCFMRYAGKVLSLSLITSPSPRDS